MTTRLIPFADAHLPTFAEALVDPEIMRFTRVPVPLPEGWIERWRTLYESSDDKKSWVIEDDSATDHGGFAGWAVAFDLDRAEGSVELGYAVAPWSRGRGIATAALRLVSSWALEQGLERLVLQIQDQNPASLRVAHAVGYTYEGTQRSVAHKNGERVDLQLWSLLPGELGSQLPI